MGASTPQIIILISVLGSGALTFGTALLTFLSTRNKIRDVHTLVNNQHDDLTNRVDQLTTQLTDSDVAVPPNGHGGKGADVQRDS